MISNGTKVYWEVTVTLLTCFIATKVCLGRVAPTVATISKAENNTMHVKRFILLSISDNDQKNEVLREVPKNVSSLKDLNYNILLNTVTHSTHYHNMTTNLKGTEQHKVNSNITLKNKIIQNTQRKTCTPIKSNDTNTDGIAKLSFIWLLLKIILVCVFFSWLTDCYYKLDDIHSELCCIHNTIKFDTKPAQIVKKNMI